MNYKTKIGIAICVGVVVIIVLAIVMVMFVQSNEKKETTSTNVVTSATNEVANSSNTSNEVNTIENETNTTQSDDNNEIVNLADISSFALQEKDMGTYLVKISDDLTSETIMNLSEENDGYNFIDYDYEDNVIYLLYSNDEILQVYSLELSSEKKSLIAEIDENNYVNSFTYLDGNIYYMSNNTAICKYDVENSSKEDIVNLGEDGNITNAEFDKENKIVYYLKNLSDGGYVCKINLENLEEIEEEIMITIETVGNGLILSDNYLAFDIMDEQMEENEEGEEDIVFYSIYYIYNMEDNSIWELGNVEITELITDIFGCVAFSKDYVVFSDGKTVKITDYEGNVKNENLYTTDEGYSIADIAMILSNSLQIRVEETGAGIEETKIIDFTLESSKNVSKNFYNILIK